MPASNDKQGALHHHLMSSVFLYRCFLQMLYTNADVWFTWWSFDVPERLLGPWIAARTLSPSCHLLPGRKPFPAPFPAGFQCGTRPSQGLSQVWYTCRVGQHGDMADACEHENNRHAYMQARHARQRHDKRFAKDTCSDKITMIELRLAVIDFVVGNKVCSPNIAASKSLPC